MQRKYKLSISPSWIIYAKLLIGLLADLLILIGWLVLKLMILGC